MPSPYLHIRKLEEQILARAAELAERARVIRAGEAEQARQQEQRLEARARRGARHRALQAQIELKREYRRLSAVMYSRWRGMWARCADKDNAGYPDYGGRGITVCSRWASFHNFWSDMREPAFPQASLGRINNDGGYSPENVRWEDGSQQAINQRVRRDSKSGVKNVSFDSNRGRWEATVMRRGVRSILYRGPSFEEAWAARAAWGNQYASP